MFVTDERTPLRTEECRIPYAQGDHRESTFRTASTQGSTTTYTADDDSNTVLWLLTARKVPVSFIDKDTEYFDAYLSFPQTFQEDSRPPPIPSAFHNAVVIQQFHAM
jgi:hypothetical protein